MIHSLFDPIIGCLYSPSNEPFPPLQLLLDSTLDLGVYKSQPPVLDIPIEHEIQLLNNRSALSYKSKVRCHMPTQ